MQRHFVPQRKRSGNAPCGAVGWDGIGSKKFAATVLVKVSARIKLSVYLIRIDVFKLGKGLATVVRLGCRLCECTRGDQQQRDEEAWNAHVSPLRHFSSLAFYT